MAGTATSALPFLYKPNYVTSAPLLISAAATPSITPGNTQLVIHVLIGSYDVRVSLAVCNLLMAPAHQFADVAY